MELLVHFIFDAFQKPLDLFHDERWTGPKGTEENLKNRIDSNENEQRTEIIRRASIECGKSVQKRGNSLIK